MLQKWSTLPYFKPSCLAVVSKGVSTFTSEETSSLSMSPPECITPPGRSTWSCLRFPSPVSLSESEFSRGLSGKVAKAIVSEEGSVNIGIIEKTTEPSLTEVLKCKLCDELYNEPRVLSCFHSFCSPCLRRLMGGSQKEKIICVQCRTATYLSPEMGLDSLLPDPGLEGMLKVFADKDGASKCTACKEFERAEAFCHDCLQFLCVTCTNAHLSMRIFERHRVERHLLAYDPPGRIKRLLEKVRHRRQRTEKDAEPKLQEELFSKSGTEYLRAIKMLDRLIDFGGMESPERDQIRSIG